jgi:hypothetical protein
MSLASCAFRPWHPDIITAIVNDKNPPQLCHWRWRKVDWGEQRKLLGFQ